MKPWAVVPVKSFTAAKSRLADLDRSRRAELARQLFAHVVRVLVDSAALAGVVVATNGDDVAELAGQLGCTVLRDAALAASAAAPGRARHGPVVDAALAWLTGEGATAAIIFMADLPRLGADEVALLAGMLARCDVAIAPDRHELGTNALGLALPARLVTSFGYADSFQRHLAAARASGLTTHIQRSPGLAFDVDLPDDYQALVGERDDRPI